MPTFDQIQSKWESLSAKEDLSAAELVSFKEEIMDSLTIAPSREDRKYLSGLLATVQNKVFALAKDVSKDKLSAVLADVDFAKGVEEIGE